MTRTTAALLFALILGIPQHLQASPTPDESAAMPLTVTAQYFTNSDGQCKGGPGVLAQFRYEGDQPLRGYLVKFDFASLSAGKKQHEQTLQEIRAQSEPMIAPGEEWTRTLCHISPRLSPQNKKIQAEPPPIHAEVDVLKFADGSIQGPLSLRASHQLVGEIDGMDFLSHETELQRFVSPLLPQDGPMPAQRVKSRTIGPLKIVSGAWRDEQGRDQLAAEVTNQSRAPIRGFLLKTVFFDPATGDRIRRFTIKELETHGNPSDYLVPGASWVIDPHNFSYLPDGTPAPYEISIDLVVFANGSTFGPKNSQESDEVVGMFQGIDRALRANQEPAPTK
jgi:hypothetical protein